MRRFVYNVIARVLARVPGRHRPRLRRLAWRLHLHPPLLLGGRGLVIAGKPNPFLPVRSVYLKDPCVYCGEEATTLDHIVPRARGGARGHAWDKVAPACWRCNHDKGCQPLLLFLRAKSARLREDARETVVPRETVVHRFPVMAAAFAKILKSAPSETMFTLDRSEKGA